MGIRAVGLLLVIAFGAAVGGRVEAQRQVFRVSIDTVVVDVSVFDGAGRPVTGLTADDFTIVEAGKPRPISTFQAVQLPGAVAVPASWPVLSPDVVRNDGASDPRAIVIVLDDATLPGNSEVWLAAAKRTAVRIVNELRPGDLAAIVATRGTESQDFTTDRSRLLRFIEALRPGTRLIDAGEAARQAAFLEAPLTVMGNMSGFLAALPDRRKLMFYVGVGVPIDFELIAKPIPLSPEGIGPRAIQAVHYRLNDSLIDLLARAKRANVQIYTFDPTGTGGVEPVVDAALDMDKVEEPTVRRTSHSFLRRIAEDTGGRAFVESNAPEEGVGAAFAENQSYYLLGYTPEKPGGGAKGEISVRVRRPGVVVRHRTQPVADSRREPAKLALQKELEAILPKADLPMQIWAAPYWNAERKEAAVAIVLGLRPAAPPSGPVTETTEVAIVAFDHRAKPHESHTVKADLSVQPTPTGSTAYEIVSELRLEPGAYRIRVAADNPRLGKSGSVFVDVDVPDFANERLSVSGLALATTPSWAAFPKARLASLLPLSPTSRRDFAASDVITLFARLHQGRRAAPAAVNLRLAVVDAAGARVFERVSTVEPSLFDESGAEIDLRFEASTFRPGRYLLTLHAALPDAAVERQVSFSVR